MKYNCYFIVAALGLLAAFGCGKKNASGPVDFELSVERTAAGVTMQSVRGAEWKELQWSCKKFPCKFIVDQSGVSGEENKAPKTSGFAFTMAVTENGADMISLRGTEWQALQFSCPTNPCKFTVDTKSAR